MSNLINQTIVSLSRYSNQIFKGVSRQSLQSSKRYYPQVRQVNTSSKLRSNDNHSLPNAKSKIFKGAAFTWRNVTITCVIGGGFLVYLYYLKKTKENAIELERRRQIGKAAIGGSFELVDPEGKLVKSSDFLGQWLLIYFGFTHCPDVCPDEIEKMTTVVDKLEKEYNIKTQPIFISVDPNRDTPEVVGKYIKEFSDKIIGLTGSAEQVGKACKAYRVYYSNGPKDQDSDYIVDHTIIIYLIDPEGLFVDYYGLTHTVDQIAMSVHINKMKFDRIKNNSWIPSLST